MSRQFPPHANLPTPELIESRVAMEPMTGCWLWLGAVNTNGYGRVRSLGKNRETHRLAWEIFRGPIPDQLFVLHRCDVRSCCNPDHLFLGTNADNMADMKKKGRGRSARGENHHQKRLTSEVVLAIRAAAGKYRDLAAQFGVSFGMISHIKNGKRWQHLQGGSNDCMGA